MNWIDVKHAMPEKATGVLISRKGVVFYAFWDDVISDSGDWYDMQNCIVLEDVTHWMPLPQPPEKDL